MITTSICKDFAIPPQSPNIFFSVVKYNNLKWLRAILLNPFFNLRHIKKICLKVSEFTKDDKILKSIRSND